ncbi:hypothetical protein D3C76_1769940 [compost metagenome]
MLSKTTEETVDKLISEAAGATLRSYQAGSGDPAALEALASLINAARGDPTGDKIPIIGFVQPAPGDDE